MRQVGLSIEVGKCEEILQCHFAYAVGFHKPPYGQKTRKHPKMFHSRTSSGSVEFPISWEKGRPRDVSPEGSGSSSCLLQQAKMLAALRLIHAAILLARFIVQVGGLFGSDGAESVECEVRPRGDFREGIPRIYESLSNRFTPSHCCHELHRFLPVFLTSVTNRGPKDEILHQAQQTTYSL